MGQNAPPGNGVTAVTARGLQELGKPGSGLPVMRERDRLRNRKQADVETDLRFKVKLTNHESDGVQDQINLTI